MKALITGITGQDGRFLAELLLAKGYTVIGTTRNAASPLRSPDGKNLKGNISLIPCDIINRGEVERLVKIEKPDEIYNLAAVSDYAAYSADPLGSHLVNGVTPVLIMESIRAHHPRARFFQAGTSQVFGRPDSLPQNEQAPFRPPNPYAASKSFAHFMGTFYRNQHRLFIVNGILFSHESIIRSETFVTRKISKGVAAIKAGKATAITLGNLEATRDWGYAGDFVNAYWLSLQQDAGHDYVIGTGERHTVREFAQEAFRVAGIPEWEGCITQDQRFMRGSDADLQQADPSKILKIGWKPRMTFKELVRMMVEHDIKGFEQIG